MNYTVLETFDLLREVCGGEKGRFIECLQKEVKACFEVIKSCTPHPVAFDANYCVGDDM
jgi:hypothetical protein